MKDISQRLLDNGPFFIIVVLLIGLFGFLAREHALFGPWIKVETDVRKYSILNDKCVVETVLWAYTHEGSTIEDMLFRNVPCSDTQAELWRQARAIESQKAKLERHLGIKESKDEQFRD
jgi:hypothetical protein